MQGTLNLQATDNDNDQLERQHSLDTQPELGALRSWNLYNPWGAWSSGGEQGLSEA